MKVKCELLYNLHRDYKVYLGEFISNYIPRVGEIINIDGNPFIVYRVGVLTVTNIYISVFKAGTFDLEIGGLEY